jgi:hypothetical protein
MFDAVRAREPDYYLVRGDTARRIDVQLCDASCHPVDLTDADRVTSRFKRIGPGSLTAVYDCVIDDAEKGLVYHAFQNGSTDIAGDWLIQFQVFWGPQGDRVETYPKGRYQNLLLRIQPRL